MNDADEKKGDPPETEEPQLYALKREDGGYKLDRRSFLKAAAGATAASMASQASGCNLPRTTPATSFQQVGGNKMLVAGKSQAALPRAHGSWVHSVAFSPDGRILVPFQIEGFRVLRKRP